MKQIFDGVTKESIIGDIILITGKITDAHYNISISRGQVKTIDKDRILIIGKGSMTNCGLSSLKKEDLIIVLRYVQNMQKCREIALKNTKYRDIYDLNNRKWNKVPINKEEVNKKINEYLRRKKEVATTKKDVIITDATRKIAQTLKKSLDELKIKFPDNDIDLCYDVYQRNFLIIISNYREDPFGINIIQIMSNFREKYRMDCNAISVRDYTKKVKDHKYGILIYF